MHSSQIKTALISVYDKTGIAEFAKKLSEKGVKIISTGGTAKAIQDAGVEVVSVSDFTGSPEILGGRVKSLHPKIHGAILARRDNEQDMKELEDNGISTIDMVVVNLYPFEEKLQNENLSEDEMIEFIDIGGPTMIRSAAKNFKWLTVAVDPADYEQILSEIDETGNTKLETRRKLAREAFTRTFTYDSAIEGYFRKNLGEAELLNLYYKKVRDLRYGENPHQKASFFRNPNNTDANVTNGKVLHGKELSFNNIVDADSALELVKEFDDPTAVFIKHNNPCGVACAATLERAFELGHEVDSQSAYGCVIALNRPCNMAVVEYMKEKKMFVELIICPSFEKDALEALQQRKNLRLIEVGELKIDKDRRDIKKVAGGILIQNSNTVSITRDDIEVVSERKPTEDEIDGMLFANKVCKRVMSNSIIFAKKLEDGSLVTTGIGAGQMSRVDSVWIAARKGGDKVPGSVMASDAFLPFPDAAEEAHKAGITALIHPGGSIRDDVVKEYVDSVDMAMVISGKRLFRH